RACVFGQRRLGALPIGVADLHAAARLRDAIAQERLVQLDDGSREFERSIRARGTQRLAGASHARQRSSVAPIDRKPDAYRPRNCIRYGYAWSYAGLGASPARAVHSARTVSVSQATAGSAWTRCTACTRIGSSANGSACSASPKARAWRRASRVGATATAF